MPLWRVELWRGKKRERDVYVTAAHAPEANLKATALVPSDQHFGLALRPRPVEFAKHRDPCDGVRRIHASVDGEWVGSIEFGMPSNSRQRAYGVVCGWLRVDEAARRSGIGTELFAQFLAWAGTRTIYAEYTPEGAAFVRAYQQKHGPIVGLRGGWEK